MNQLIPKNEQTEFIDISLESTRRKKFRIDKDDNRILELDTTDLRIIDRFQKKYDELVAAVDSAFKDMPVEDVEMSEDDINSEYVSGVISSIVSVDTKIRDIIDQIFDSNVSEVCAPYGSMIDPVNGKLRFEHIFDALVPLYQNDIDVEIRKLNTRMQKHTDKYTKKKN